LHLGQKEPDKLTLEDAHGPAIRNDMMHSQQELMFLLVESEQGGSQERPLCQRIGVQSLLSRQATCERVSLGERKARQVDDREWQVQPQGICQAHLFISPPPLGRDGGNNHLHRVSLPLVECCTQYFM